MRLPPPSSPLVGARPPAGLGFCPPLSPLGRPGLAAGTLCGTSGTVWRSFVSHALLPSAASSSLVPRCRWLPPPALRYERRPWHSVFPERARLPPPLRPPAAPRMPLLGRAARPLVAAPRWPPHCPTLCTPAVGASLLGGAWGALAPPFAAAGRSPGVASDAYAPVARPGRWGCRGADLVAAVLAAAPKWVLTRPGVALAVFLASEAAWHFPPLPFARGGMASAWARTPYVVLVGVSVAVAAFASLAYLDRERRQGLRGRPPTRRFLRGGCPRGDPLLGSLCRGLRTLAPALSRAAALAAPSPVGIATAGRSVALCAHVCVATLTIPFAGLGAALDAALLAAGLLLTALVRLTRAALGLLAADLAVALALCSLALVAPDSLGSPLPRGRGGRPPWACVHPTLRGILPRLMVATRAARFTRLPPWVTGGRVLGFKIKPARLVLSPSGRCLWGLLRVVGAGVRGALSAPLSPGGHPLGLLFGPAFPSDDSGDGPVLRPVVTKADGNCMYHSLSLFTGDSPARARAWAVEGLGRLTEGPQRTHALEGGAARDWLRHPLWAPAPPGCTLEGIRS